MTTTIILALLVFAGNLLAQSPLGFNYQAVLRHEGGEPIVSEEVQLGIAILEGSPEGTEVFTETHHVTTNEFGLISIHIGSESSLEGIDWGSGNYFIEVSVDGSIMGTSQLLSVPFALHSHTSADAFSGDYHDLENTPDLDHFVAIDAPAQGDMLYFDGENWQPIGIGQDGQVLTVQNGAIHWADLPEHDNGDDEGTMTDIDGNVYQTVVIDNLEWMVGNLRTTHYADGTPIPTGLSNSEWEATSEGAYAVFPFDHELSEGMDSEEEVIEAYGLLYNWHAVMDPRGICPEGWRVPKDEEYTDLENYLINVYDDIYWGNVGSALKDCRAINSPLGEDCNTEEHPRWIEHDTDYWAFDLVGFGALPGGVRATNGTFFQLGSNSFNWTSSESDIPNFAWYRDMGRSSGSLFRAFGLYNSGYSVRCLRDAE